MPPRLRLLIVDDEPHLRASLGAWFRDEGYEVALAGDGAEAMAQIERQGSDLALLDIRLPDIDGLDLQRAIADKCPDCTIVIMTAFGAVETAVQALKQGAYDYVLKPCNPEDLSRLLNKAGERYNLLRQNRALREQLQQAAPQLVFDENGPMGAVVEQVEQVAATDTSVMLSGESGTGKEVVAQLIHARSRRSAAPLVTVNCGGLAEGVLESELFGHERGAFTGAVSRRQGRVELAHEGTLFLDEIGDIPPKMQVDLLRVLQERQVTRVGGQTSIPVDFRLISATHRDLATEVDAGRFRSDLYFRINVFALHVPALRERPRDVPLLAEHFRERLSRRMNRKIVGFTQAAMNALCAHEWPGNVRELENAIERAFVVCRGSRIDAEHFPFGRQAEQAPLDLTLANLEQQHIRRVLSGCGFNVTQAAKQLGIDRVTLYNKMKRYGISRDRG
jgi:DNA-binding NtrC family response regulator